MAAYGGVSKLLGRLVTMLVMGEEDLVRTDLCLEDCTALQFNDCSATR